MRTIWKYELEVTDQQIHAIPEGGVILCIQVQREHPCIWVLVNREHPQEERTFRICGTGHEISENEDLSYIGSFQLYNGAFVGHLFEMRE